VSDDRPDDTPDRPAGTPSDVPWYGVPPPAAPPPQGWGPPPGWGQPPAYPSPYPSGYAPPTKTNNKAIVAFIIAIASCGLCPVVGPVAALVLAAGARREIAASYGRETGNGLVTAAQVIAVVHLVLTVLWVVLRLASVTSTSATP
jgi:hypothetical protein